MLSTVLNKLVFCFTRANNCRIIEINKKSRGLIGQSVSTSPVSCGTTKVFSPSLPVMNCVFSKNYLVLLYEFPIILCIIFSNTDC